VALTGDQARETYARRGWPVAEEPGGTWWLATGSVVDALEVPRAAGRLAVAWWLFTQGLPDEGRGLPALPSPAGALAVVTAGDRCYFLAQPGGCPWDTASPALPGAEPASGRPVVARWHAAGSRVPVPPSVLAGGGRAVWAGAPLGAGPLAPAVALLDLLAKAVTVTAPGHQLALAGGFSLARPASPAGEAQL
jgi:hypothetical protein